jgi:hypothetical protein
VGKPVLTSRQHPLTADKPWGDAHGFRFGTLGLPGTNEVVGIPLHGHRYEITAGTTSVTL